jgi:alpha-L-rhamnosidase
VYGVAAGIRPAAPGYEKAVIAPVPDARLDWLKAEVQTRHGLISSRWKKADGGWRFEIETPVETEVIIAGETHTVAPGRYVFVSQ